MIARAERPSEQHDELDRYGIDPFAGPVRERVPPARPGRPTRAPFVRPPAPASSGPQWPDPAPTGSSPAALGPRSGHPRSHRPPDPPPPRRWSAVVLSVLLVVGLLVAGGVVMLVQTLSARTEDQQVSFGSLDYRVPADWTIVPEAPGTSPDGVMLDGVATATTFACDGRRHSRATVGHTFVVRGDGHHARTEDAARDLGPKFAASFYGPGATLAASAPAPLTIGNLPGTALLVNATPKVSAGDCPEPKGTVTVVALPSDRRGAGGESGILLLVVQRDTAGGPAATAMVDERAVAGILSSVEVNVR